MIAQGPPPLHIHFLDCGQGNMVLVVTPDARVLLCDCRVTDEDAETSLGYLARYIPWRPDPEDGGKPRQWVDWFISSHRDQDHLHGLQSVNARFPIRGIVDSGTTSGSSSGAENLYYMQLCRALRARYGDSAVVVPRPSISPLFSFGGLSVYCLCSGVDDDPSDDGHYGNIVLQLDYAGNRIMLPGDSDWRAWKEKIVPTFEASGLLKTTVLLASHHGSRSFFVDIDPFTADGDDEWDDAYYRHLDLMAPSMTIVSCGSQEHQNHPDPTARRAYENRTANKQVYLTRNKGSLVGCFYANGDWTVVPCRFLSKWDYARYAPAGKTFWLECDAVDVQGTSAGKVSSGDQVLRGNRLKFTALSKGGLVTGAATYTFEVSNGGTGPDADHDEIYHKGAKEDGPARCFERDVRFRGVHLLRCRVKDSTTGQVAQTVFVVRGE